jgi:hypothetical protein
MTSPADRPLWRCARCGHSFVGVNMAHSCVTVALDDLFARSTAEARAAFDAFVALFERCGPVEVIGQKTRIVITARVRFAGATVLRDRVRLNIALTRRIEAPWVERIDTYLGGRWNAHHFLVRSPEELADIGELPSLACEGYRDLGMQGALRADGTGVAAGDRVADA